MNNKEGYDLWSSSYDDVINKTRDLESLTLRETLIGIPFIEVLEIGCGTGKNTNWLSDHSDQVIAIDFSLEMVKKAKEKVADKKVEFRQVDIRDTWRFEQSFDLVTASLVLEHINDLDHIFKEVHKVLKPGGKFYVGELHPFKQYEGSKARFEQDGQTIVLDCFIHHISDYFHVAINNGFECLRLNEYFDDDEERTIPRLIAMLFRKK